MNEYITVKEMAEKWGITPRRIQVLCNENRVEGAVKQAGVWFIPCDAQKPTKRRGLKCDERKKSSLRVLSLFSGCGGMDLGFEGDFDVLSSGVNTKVHPDWEIRNGNNKMWVHLPKTRFRNVFANDIREDAKTAWTNYFAKKGISESVYCLDSIVDLVKLHRENGIDVFPKNIDVVTGGFPCQDFSVAGKRMGFNSDKSHTGSSMTDRSVPSIESRGKLYMWMREVIDITEPKVFVAENVKGLTNLADVKEIIEDDFRTVSSNGYLVVSAKTLQAADYGVPQSRERIIFIGFKKSELTEKAKKALSLNEIPPEYAPYPPITHAYNVSGEDLLPPTNLRQAFFGLNEPEVAEDLSQQRYSKAKYMGKHCQGQNEVNLDGIAPTIRSEHHGNIEFRRLSDLHGGKNCEELEKGLKERRLTIRECARIQTFPDDYEFIIPAQNGKKGVSASDAYKIIGNAVPPLLAYNIAKQIEKNWDLYFGGKKDDNIRE